MRKTRTAFAFALALRMAFPVFAQAPGVTNHVREQITTISQGTLIDVLLVGKRERIHGLRGEVFADGFLLVSANSGKAGSERIAFTDVRTVNVARVHTVRNVLLVVSGAAAIAFLVLAAGAFRR